METTGFDPGIKEILITGGTSGLGLELVKLFLEKGFKVVVTGRDPSRHSGCGSRLEFVVADFADLKKSARTFAEIAGRHDFRYVINNAGVLSPFHYKPTPDGLEYTFQVNFLTHLVLNEIIIRLRNNNLPLVILAITSPAYRLYRMISGNVLKERSYNPARAYSESKYLVSLMCKDLSFRYRDQNVCAISFNPGIFRSAIFRMQNPLFRSLYSIAAPFMRDPVKVAQSIVRVLESDSIDAGMIYNRRNESSNLHVSYDNYEEAFLAACL